MIIADDFGIDKDSTDAQLELARAGLIHGVSVLVYKTRIKDAAHLKDCGVRIGLHLDLIETGLYPWTSPLGLIFGNRKKIIKEIDSQFDKFYSLFGMAPDFIDGHLHLHGLPRVSNLFFQCYQKRFSQSQIKPWIRSLNVSWGFLSVLLQVSFFSFLKCLFWKLFSLNKKELDCRVGIGIYHFKEREVFLTLLSWYQLNTSPKHVFITHPSLSKELGEWRHHEYCALKNNSTNNL